MGDYNNPNDPNQQQGNQNQDIQNQGYQQQGYQQPGYQQPGYQQPGYQQQPQYQQPYNQFQQPPKSNGMAIASMVCGIVSLLLVCCFWYVALPAAVVGLILGIISIRGGNGGKGMAIAGVVTAGITLLLSILAIIGCSALYGGILEEIKNSVNYY